MWRRTVSEPGGEGDSKFDGGSDTELDGRSDTDLDGRSETKFVDENDTDIDESADSLDWFDGLSDKDPL